LEGGLAVADVQLEVGLKVQFMSGQNAPSGVAVSRADKRAPTDGVVAKPAVKRAAAVNQRPRSRWFSESTWPLVSVAGGLLFWEVATRLIGNRSLFLSAPSEIIAAIVKLAGDRLPYDIGLSGIEFLVGYLLAAVAGFAIGAAMASSADARAALSPWISGLYATPTIALAPLFILWLGIGVWSKIAVVFILVIFPVVLNTEAGLRTTSTQLIEMVYSLGASRSQIFWKVSLPSALPFIFAGLKIGIGRGLIGVVVAELFGSRAGLGQLITQSAETFNMPELFAGVVILAAAGIALTAAFNALERRVVHWN
jgi:NitT/TauT family transport system permease protein